MMLTNYLPFLIVLPINNYQVNCFWFFSSLLDQQSTQSWINLSKWFDPVTLQTYFNSPPPLPPSLSPPSIYLRPPLPYFPPFTRSQAIPSQPLYPTYTDQTSRFLSNSPQISSTSNIQCLCDGPKTYPVVTCSSLSSKPLTLSTLNSLILNMGYPSLGRLTIYNITLQCPSTSFLTFEKPLQHLRLTNLTIIGSDCVDALSIIKLPPSSPPSTLRRLEINSIELSAQTVPNFPFKSLTSTDYPQLKDIDLRYNGLSSIPDYAFPFNPSIETIDLSFNKITYLGSYAFQQLTNLKQLILSKNKLKVVNNHALAGNPLKPNNLNNLVIDLTHNQMFHLTTGVFDNLFPSYLDLRYNSLVSLEEKIFSSLIRTMSQADNSVINVSSNRFQCSCSKTRWLIELNDDQKRVIHGFNCMVNNSNKTLSSLTLADVDC